MSDVYTYDDILEAVKSFGAYDSSDFDKPLRTLILLTSETVKLKVGRRNDLSDDAHNQFFNNSSLFLAGVVSFTNYLMDTGVGSTIRYNRDRADEYLTDTVWSIIEDLRYQLSLIPSDVERGDDDGQV